MTDSEMRTKATGDCAKFIKDMDAAGISVRWYCGCFFWKGPAVVVASLQYALSATKVKCQWDNMGLDWVVYPVERMSNYPD